MDATGKLERQAGTPVPCQMDRWLRWLFIDRLITFGLLFYVGSTQLYHTVVMRDRHGAVQEPADTSRYDYFPEYDGWVLWRRGLNGMMYLQGCAYPTGTRTALKDCAPVWLRADGISASREEIARWSSSPPVPAAVYVYRGPERLAYVTVWLGSVTLTPP